MRWNDFLNETEIRKAIDVLQAGNDIFEVRIIGTGKKNIHSAYFKDVEMLMEEFDKVDLREKNIYITLNQLKPDLFSRQQRERFKHGVNTTNDNEVISYHWLFVDVDPVRPAGISSSDEELKESQKLAGIIYRYLDHLGFEKPVKALSGNGCHLFYRIDVPNDPEGRQLVERCLKTLAMIFDSDKVKVDTTNYNPSRICKLHGTLAQKGANSADRPHRMSRIFQVPDNVQITSKGILQKLVAELPEPPQPSYRNQPRQAGGFDLINFMNEHGLTYQEDKNDRAVIYKLDACPFDSSHKDGDAKIFQYSNGAIAFKCHHNSCSEYRWQDVRKKFDPNAYDYDFDSNRIDYGWQLHNRNKKNQEVPYEELTDEGTMFRTAREIYDDPEPEYEYIRSGITVIDEKLKGLQKSAVSVVTGVRGSGKTTLIGQLIINAVQDGHNVVCYSGELNNKKYLNWLIRQAAGHNNVDVSKGYRINDSVKQAIIDWFGDHFFLFNNKYGNRFDKIEQHLRVKLKEYKADLCILDNMMALDLHEYDQRDKYDAQTKFVWALKNLAELTNTHVLFVAHPRKLSGFLRLDDISGTGNIGNIVDNAFIVHRCNKDFRDGFKAYIGASISKQYEYATNVVEIAKDREFGTQDEFVALYYDTASKRLKNDVNEVLHYGWESDDLEDDFNPADDFDENPF